MKKIVYTRPDGGITVVIPAPKEHLEKLYGKLSDSQYEDIVNKANDAKMKRRGAKNIRVIDDSDIPADREFRDAWVDVSDETKIDICCEKAKDLKLKEMRLKREELFKDADRAFMLALEDGSEDKINEAKKEKQKLRDLTEPLKELEVKGKLNDKKLLRKMKDLADV